jgi:hypothetical protein
VCRDVVVVGASILDYRVLPTSLCHTLDVMG